VSKPSKIIIIGGGTGGISVASRLRRELSSDARITLIDPAQQHFYQPLWTLVGAGVVDHAASERSMQSLIPIGVEWLQQAVASFQPESNQITLIDNTVLDYDILVVAPGIQLNWEKIKGVKEALEYDNVCSNYLPHGSTKTWQVLQKVQDGNAVFTQPPLPIKCAGAPQKAAYLADAFFRRAGRRGQVNVMLALHNPRIFGVEKYRLELEKIVASKGIDARYEHNLVEIRPAENVAIFERANGEREEIKYSMLHLVPPQSAPDFVKHSPLADAQGWVDVDKHTLQHKRFPNVFSLGDASSLPTSRTGAAIRKEAPVLAANVIAFLKGEALKASYDGYSSCPIVTEYGKVLLAEFDYDGKPTETFPFNQAKPRRSMWLLKLHLLPQLYWKFMLKGRA
jgi:sulfide:quinone oxidoreductase